VLGVVVFRAKQLIPNKFLSILASQKSIILKTFSPEVIIVFYFLPGFYAALLHVAKEVAIAFHAVSLRFY